MLVKASFSSLKDGKWYEYVVRFILGGATTVFAGLISKALGPSIGGLFLALLAIFCASATLIERHEIRRKRKAGLTGTRRGQEAAALDAAGAALGGLGLVAFAVLFTILVTRSVAAAFVAALAAYLAVSLAAWWLHRRMRLVRRSERR
jgi:hypothetical protein